MTGNKPRTSERKLCLSGNQGTVPAAEPDGRARRIGRIARHPIKDRGAQRDITVRFCLQPQGQRCRRKDRRAVRAGLADICADPVRRIDEQPRRIEHVELGIEIVKPCADRHPAIGEAALHPGFVKPQGTHPGLDVGRNIAAPETIRAECLSVVGKPVQVENGVALRMVEHDIEVIDRNNIARLAPGHRIERVGNGKRCLIPSGLLANRHDRPACR